MGMIYFAQAGDYVKVGWTTRLDDRIPRLTRPGEMSAKPEAVIGIHVIDILRIIKDARVRDEHRLHALLEAHRDVGEWFRATPEFLELVKTLDFETEHAMKARLRRERREAKADAA